MREEQKSPSSEPQRLEAAAAAVAKQDRDRERTARRESFSDEDNPLICRGID